jgi:hypothetical protein
LRLDRLTPGDVFLAARRAELLGVKDPALLIQWLEDEIAAREGGQRRRIGF